VKVLKLGERFPTESDESTIRMMAPDPFRDRIAELDLLRRPPVACRHEAIRELPARPKPSEPPGVPWRMASLSHKRDLFSSYESHAFAEMSAKHIWRPSAILVYASIPCDDAVLLVGDGALQDADPIRPSAGKRLRYLPPEWKDVDKYTYSGLVDVAGSSRAAKFSVREAAEFLLGRTDQKLKIVRIRA